MVTDVLVTGPAVPVMLSQLYMLKAVPEMVTDVRARKAVPETGHRCTCSTAVPEMVSDVRAKSCHLKWSQTVHS